MMGRISNITDTVEDLKLAFRVFDKESTREYIPTTELRYVLEYLARTDMIDHEEVDECLEYFDADNNGLINFEEYLEIMLPSDKKEKELKDAAKKANKINNN